MKGKPWTVLALAALLLGGPALANASDSETFTVTVSGVESVDIQVPSSTTVDYHNSGGICSPVDRFCAWYPTVLYSTNYTTNRKLVARATTSSPILSVVLEKQQAYPNPFTPPYGSGSNPGSWAFSNNTLTLTATDQDIVVGIQNGSNYAIAPVFKLVFSSNPAPGTYTATVTFTIMAQ